MLLLHSHVLKYSILCSALASVAFITGVVAAAVVDIREHHAVAIALCYNLAYGLDFTVCQLCERDLQKEFFVMQINSWPSPAPESRQRKKTSARDPACVRFLESHFHCMCEC